jgi:hypothetical protein
VFAALSSGRGRVPRFNGASPDLNAKTPTPRQPRDRTRSLPFTEVHECLMTGHDGSQQFAADRVGRSSKLVMRVRFPSPALANEPVSLMFSIPDASAPVVQPRANPARALAETPKICLTPRQPRERSTRTIGLHVGAPAASFQVTSSRGPVSERTGCGRSARNLAAARSRTSQPAPTAGHALNERHRPSRRSGKSDSTRTRFG